MNNEDYSLSVLGDALFEVIHNSDVSTESILDKIRDVIRDSETYLESRLDRTRDLLRYFPDDESDVEEIDLSDGYEWTPLFKKNNLADFNNTKSKYYRDTDRNR